MINKKTKRQIGRRLGIIFLKLCSSVSGIVPLRWNYCFGWLVGKLFYRFVTRYRNSSLESLAIAFPDKSPKERKAIAKESIILMMKSALEVISCVRNPKIFANVRFEGTEYLEQALKLNKGVIGVTAHFSNFALMTLKFAHAGYPTAAMVRPMRDPETGDFLNDLRTYFGVKSIQSRPRKAVIVNTIEALRNNNLVLIQMDQNFSNEGGVWVEFFGELAATPTGPIAFALKTGAAVLPIHIVREGLGKHCIRIEPPVVLDKTDDKDETVFLNTIKVTKIIERWVRENPEQWAWIHRRWKSRPPEEVKNKKYKLQEI